MGNITQEKLFNKWIHRVKRTQLAHRFAAKGTSRAHLCIGIPAAAISALVATSVFASWEEGLLGYGRIITGMLSISSAILISLQTFLRLEEQSSKHQLTDARYGTIRQKMEHRIAFPTVNNSELDIFCAEVTEELDDLARKSPVVAERYWRKARNTIINTQQQEKPH